MRGGMTLLQFSQLVAENVRHVHSRVNDSLNLHWGTSRDVGDGPTGLFSDAIFGRRQETQKGGKRSRRDDDLSLQIIAGHDVSDRSKSGGLHSRRGVPTGASALESEDGGSKLT
jgi:hypothetical protein